MEYTLAQKAYEIDFSKIEGGFLFDPQMFITYSDTENKAKIDLLKKAIAELITLCGDNEVVTYFNIPVVRCKEEDKYEFEGQNLTKSQIDEIFMERQRISKLEEILNDPKIEFCYIEKGLYYLPNYRGQTEFKHKAGIYTKEEAVRYAKSCRYITLEAIDKKCHNFMIKQQIRELETRILK